MMDLSQNIAAFQNATLSITRREAVTYVNGLPQAGSTTSLQIPAVVTPASGRALEVLPEGMRSSRALEVMTASEIRGTLDPNQHQGDRFDYGVETFEVQTVEDWSAAAGYWWAIATKVDTA